MAEELTDAKRVELLTMAMKAIAETTRLGKEGKLPASMALFLIDSLAVIAMATPEEIASLQDA